MYYSLCIFVLKVRERLRQAVDKNNTLEAELEETREKVIIYNVVQFFDGSSILILSFFDSLMPAKNFM